MTRRSLTLIAVAVFAMTATGAPTGAQTVTVDASEAIRQIHMSDMITSGEQLQQQRFQSLMQQPSGGYGGGSSVPHMDRSQADALARKAQALDAFVPDPAATKALVRASVSQYTRDASKSASLNKMLADLIAKTHDTASIDKIYAGLMDEWHSVARKQNFGNRVSEAYLYLVEVSYSIRSADLHRPEAATLRQLSFGLQNAFVDIQLSQGHAFSNAEKQKLYDSLGTVGLLIATLFYGKLGDDLAAEAKAEGDRTIAKFGPPSEMSDIVSFAQSVEHRATTTLLLRYPDALALR